MSGRRAGHSVSRLHHRILLPLLVLIAGACPVANAQFLDTTVYSTGNIAAPIPDGSLVNIHLNVPDAPRSITDVDVRVRINHTFDSDLQLTVVHPGGTRVALSNNNNGEAATTTAAEPTIAPAPKPVSTTVLRPRARRVCRRSSSPAGCSGSAARP